MNGVNEDVSDASRIGNADVPNCAWRAWTGSRVRWRAERTSRREVLNSERRKVMNIEKERDQEHAKGRMAIKTPPILSEQEWEAARQQLLVKEKALTHSRDALAAERRRMPWMAVEKKYEFNGPKGKVGLLDLFEGRKQLIV